MLLVSPKPWSFPHWVVPSPGWKIPELSAFWQSSFLALGWQILLLTFWYPEVMPQLWVNYSLYSSSFLCWAILIFIGTKHVMYLLSLLMPFQVTPPPQKNTTPPLQKKKRKTKKQLSFFFSSSLKCFRTIKTLGRFGIAEWYVWGWIGSIFPIGYNKGFILNSDTVQHSLWLEVGRGTSTSHYENSRVHSAWKAATLGKFQSHVSPCWKAVESQHRMTWQSVTWDSLTSKLCLRKPLPWDGNWKRFINTP